MAASPRVSSGLGSESRKMMTIHVAENGHSYQLECEATTTVERVQSCLAPLIGVAQHHQLLIVGEVKLESHHMLSTYRLPAEDRPIFVFNKQNFSPDSAAPVPEISEPVVETVLQACFQSSHPLDEGADPALRTLPSYEREFKYHFEKGNAILAASQRKYDACRKLLHEQQVQQLAIGTAKKNVDRFFQVISESLEEFMKCYSKQHQQHSKLLRSFERDLQRLRTCELHPALQTPVRKTLIDCIHEAGVRKSHELCSNSDRQFHAKVSQLKAAFSSLQSSMEDLLSASMVDIPHVDDTIRKHASLIEEQASIIQSLAKDLDTVKKLMENKQRSHLLRVHDAISALGPMHEVHSKNHLPRIEACDREFSKLLTFCRSSKNKMSLFVHKRLQGIAALQRKIQDMRNQLAGFEEVMAHQEKLFTKLKYVRRMGSSYRACLAEVVRRKAYMKLYMGQAGQLAEKLARERDREVARREEFLALRSLYIPHDLLLGMGLLDSPSHCVVSITPFDTHLLDVDIADLDRSNPNHLLASNSFFLGSNQPQLKSSSELMSGIQTTCGIDSTIGDEGIEDGIVDERSCEILGTSKLEVENVRLKAKLAAALVMLSDLDSSIDLELVAGDYQSSELDDGKGTMNASKKTMEAFRLKDEHTEHLNRMLSKSRGQCKAYERRIKELELMLQEKHQQLAQNLQKGDISEELLGLEMPERRAEFVRRWDPLVVTGLELVAVNKGTVSSVDRKLSGIQHPMPRLGNTDDLAHEGEDETMGKPIIKGQDLYRPRLTERDMHDKQPATENFVANEIALDGEGRAAEPAEVEGDFPACMTELRNQISALQSALQEKSNLCDSAENRAKKLSEELLQLQRGLDSTNDLLRECQMNCAHLENRLHEAREEARANLGVVNHRTSDNDTFRTSSLDLQGFMERLRACISAPVGEVKGFIESIMELSSSLASSSVNEDGGVGFSDSIRVLAEKVGDLVQQRAKLLDRCTKAEAAQTHLRKELQNKTDMLKSIYTKRKLEKQACKEKICFTHFEVHELAVFLPNAAGFHEALNRNCPNYYLSNQSIALFMKHYPSQKDLIVGQIVHIDRHVACVSPYGSESEPFGPSTNTAGLGGGTENKSNPYRLAVGTVYFVVTLAIIPEITSKISVNSAKIHEVNSLSSPIYNI